MRLLLIAFVLLFSYSSKAQFGAGLSYDLERAPQWDLLDMGSDSIDRSEQFASFSVYYWFRLKNRRIEFLPEIAYRRNFGSIEPDRLLGQTHSIDINFNSDFYVFDLASDCNCPTFSKDGDILKRGFFVEVSPGLSFRQYEIKPSESNENPEATDRITDVLAKVAVGIGLDIGVNDLLTITPTIKNEWHFGADWVNFASRTPQFDLKTGRSDLSYLRFGLRLTFRPDYKPFR